MTVRADYIKSARLRASFERQLGPQASAFLRTQANGVAEAYGVGGMPGVAVRIQTDAPKLRTTLSRSYVAVSSAQMDVRAQSLGRTLSRFTNPRVVEFAETQSAQKVAAINRATMRRIQRVVAGSLADQATVDEVARDIQSALSGSSRARAFQIARTEIGTAAAFGDQTAAEESGLNLVKVWLTARDGGVRHPSYPDLEGQTVGLHELFTVGESQLRFPLDPHGPAEEVVNCRCVLDYQPAR